MKFTPAPPLIPLTAAECLARAQGQAPRLRRRMAGFLYEGVLLFGLLMIVGLIYAIITGQRHAMNHREGLQASIFLMLSLYFIWFWTHGGQTLAMRTWHLRLVSLDGQPLSLKQALVRYISCWLWFIPPLLIARGLDVRHTKTIYALMLAWIAFYALLSLLHPQGQFLHDALSKTRVIDNRSDLK